MSHGIKFQVVVFSDGMVGSIVGFTLRHNDNGVLNMSNLSYYLMSILTPIFDTETAVVFQEIHRDVIYWLTTRGD